MRPSQIRSQKHQVSHCHRGRSLSLQRLQRSTFDPDTPVGMQPNLQPVQDSQQFLKPTLKLSRENGANRASACIREKTHRIGASNQARFSGDQIRRGRMKSGGIVKKNMCPASTGFALSSRRNTRQEMKPIFSAPEEISLQTNKTRQIAKTRA